MEIHDFGWGMKNHCSIQTSLTTIALSGGYRGSTVVRPQEDSSVSEVSGLGAEGEVIFTGLPPLLTARANHACGWYKMGDSKVRLLSSTSSITVQLSRFSWWLVATLTIMK